MTQAHRLLLKWARFLHVYLTLFGFALLLFFAVTGFMLNHEDWFAPRQTTKGKIPANLLGDAEDREAIIDKLREDFLVQGDVGTFAHDLESNTYRIVFRTPSNATTAVIHRESGETEVTRDMTGAIEYSLEGKLPMAMLEPWDETKKLAIVEALRKDFAARGEMSEFEAKENEPLRVMFKSPGYFAEATIQRDSGQTKVKHETRGVVGLVLDLHRGKTSGLAWSAVIDGVSILFVMVAITGLILWSSLRSRAQHGLAPR